MSGNRNDEPEKQDTTEQPKDEIVTPVRRDPEGTAWGGPTG